MNLQETHFGIAFSSRIYKFLCFDKKKLPHNIKSLNPSCWWWGCSVVLPNSIVTHFLQHDLALALIWIAVVGAIWSLRNNVIFKGDEVEIVKVVNFIQYKVWLWIKASNHYFSSSLFEWVTNPRACISSICS